MAEALAFSEDNGNQLSCDGLIYLNYRIHSVSIRRHVCEFVFAMILMIGLAGKTSNYIHCSKHNVAELAGPRSQFSESSPARN
jgi:hypothetical protein